MRRLLKVFGLILGVQFIGVAAFANCALIDRLDKIQIIETRLARSPDLALFPSDIRQLRFLIDGLTRKDTVDAFGATSFTEPGLTMLRLRNDTLRLLQSVSIDAPASVRPHFTTDVRTTLENAGIILKRFRCNAEQIAADAVITENRRTGRNTDAEDLADVAETLKG